MDRSGQVERRPWGSYSVLAEGQGFKVKVLRIGPGSRLSYQSHGHRSERWVVAKGNARIVLEGSVIELTKGGMLEVDKGEKHRIENPAKEELVIVEVQLGEVLDEEDIVRFEDDYGR